MTNKMNIRGLNSKALSVLATALLISSTAFSSALLESEFELLIPRQFQQKLISEKWKTLESEEFHSKWQLPDQRMTTQEIPVELKGLDLEIYTRLEQPHLISDSSSESQSELHLQSKGLDAVMRIASVSIDHVVEKEIGGIIGRFRIQAQCDNIQLHLKKDSGHFTVTLVSKIGSASLGAAVKGFTFGWRDNSWEADEFKCSGAKGFDDLIRQQVELVAQDAEKFVSPQHAVILAALESQLANFRVDLSGVRELVSSRPDIKASMEILSSRDDSANGIWAQGKLRLEFQKVAADSASAKTKQLILLESLLNEEPNLTQAQVRLPKDFIKEVARLSFTGKSWIERISSSKIPGFSSVMNSRFIQFFIWPELRRYSKSSRFWFDLSSNTDLVIEGVGLDYRIQSTLLAKMWAPRSTAYVPFMDFTIPVSSRMQIGVSKGVLKAKLPNPSISLGYKWNSEYRKKYSPSTRFSANTIRNKVVDALWGKTLSVQLPNIPLSEGLYLQIDRAAIDARSELNLFLK